MRWNKAFIFATGASYLGLALLAVTGYPTMISPPLTATVLVLAYMLLGVIFYVWGSADSGFPSNASYSFAMLYGVVAAITFVGFESWGGVVQNVAMASWDLACALCFAVE